MAAGSAVVIATHDPGAIAASDRVVALRHGVMSTDQWGARPPGRPSTRPVGCSCRRTRWSSSPNRRAVLRIDGDRVVLEPTAEEP